VDPDSTPQHWPSGLYIGKYPALPPPRGEYKPMPFGEKYEKGKRKKGDVREKGSNLKEKEKMGSKKVK
jgi:hypothetical protein